MQYTASRPLADVRVHLYSLPGTFDTSFTLYEDDGRSFDYQQGVYLRTQIDYQGTGDVERAVITRVEGALAPPTGRTWTLELHRLSAANWVTLNGTVQPAFPSLAALERAGAGWTLDQNRVVVRVPDSGTSIVVEISHGAQ